jgi:hypothetical protein
MAKAQMKQIAATPAHRALGILHRNIGRELKYRLVS